MNNSVVITIFEVESEAFQAFNELTKAPTGEGYTVLEAALIRNKDNAIEVLDRFGNYATTTLRYDAADIADDVNRLYNLETEISNQVIAEVKADRKAARKDRREARRAKIKADFEEYAEATNRAMGKVTPHVVL